jgi:four helix bundle protein
VQDYKKLRVWQDAHRLALETYAATAYLKAPGTWPLRDQMHRAAISVPSNIAEGSGRSSDADFRRFLFHALGSLNELEYDFLLASDLGYLPARVHAGAVGRIVDVRRMISGLITSLGGRTVSSQRG